MLILDIGTNGEILLGNREPTPSASSPTGPAFEGARNYPRHAGAVLPGAIERVRIDPATLAVTYRIIGKEEWIESIRDWEIERVGDLEQVVLPLCRRTPPPKRDALLNRRCGRQGFVGRALLKRPPSCLRRA